MEEQLHITSYIVSNQEIQVVSEMGQNRNVGYPFCMLKGLRDDFRSFAILSYEVNAVWKNIFYGG